MSANQFLNGWQQAALVILRFATGWHLFYQGFGKWISPLWTARGYLDSSWGPFLWMAGNPAILSVADFATVWGLMVLGAALMIGLFSRGAALAAMLLLSLIFAALPPLNYTGFVVPTTQGTELYVDKTLIEILSLLVVAVFPTGRIAGLDLFRIRRRIQS